MTSLESLADQLIQTVLFSAHVGEGKRNEVVVILKALENDTRNRVLEEAAQIADAEFVSYHDAANRIRALKREKRGGE